jgi:hypothetical protein
MAWFNEPELFLLGKWADARLLEDAVRSVRTKFAEVVQVVVDRVKKNHSELDDKGVYLSRDGLRSQVVIGRTNWRRKSDPLSGFFIDNLQVDSLTATDSKPPHKSIFVFNSNPKEAEAVIGKAAQRILGEQEFRRWETCDFTDGGGIWCRLEPRELFGLLVKDDARGFIDRMVAHFEQMAKFTAVVDEIVGTGKQRRN